MPSRIMQATERLRDAQIKQLDAIELIEKMKDDDTLIYADTLYMTETVSSKTHYKFGMVDDQHLKLLSTLKNHRGPVILSGYNNDLYAEELKGWSKIEFDSATGNVGRKKKIAIVVSYLKWHSIIWAIVHGCFGWFYIIYFIICGY